MDKKTIKAIRTVCGYTDDLRIKLPIFEHGNYSRYYKRIVSLIDDNRFTVGLIGNKMIGMPLVINPLEFPEAYAEKERIIDCAVRAVCNGIPY